MSVFIVGMLALLAVALCFVLPPLMRNPKLGAIDLDTVHPGDAALIVLREQKADLLAEHAAGRIDAALYEQNLAEIQRRALEEHAGHVDAVSRAPAHVWAVAVALALPLGALALYLIVGNPAGVVASAYQGTARQEEPNNQQVQAPAMGPEQIKAMVERLAAKVAANPDDIQGMAMLARSYMVLERYNDAAKIYAQIAQKQPKNAQALVDWADAIATGQNRSLAGEPGKLIARALELDPDNIKALALAGAAAFEQKDYKQAIERWEALLTKLGPVDENNPMVRSLRGGIEEARKRLQAP